MGIKLCTPLVIFASSILWLDCLPKVMLCKQLNIFALSMLWLDRLPKVKLCKLLGFTLSMLLTLSMLWLKSSPMVACSKPLGIFTFTSECVSTTGYTLNTDYASVDMLSREEAIFGLFYSFSSNCQTISI